jgi:hypothetical protein
MANGDSVLLFKYRQAYALDRTSTGIGCRPCVFQQILSFEVCNNTKVNGEPLEPTTSQIKSYGILPVLPVLKIIYQN